MPRAPIWVIAGPTASGKTELAIETALRHDVEIISADSQQVYRHFDVGTAKPTPSQLGQVPHHLISCIDPHEQFSAAQFMALADQTIQAIEARGKQVVVVGGTGLYLRALLHGVIALPPVDVALRAALEAEIQERGPGPLHTRLLERDPASAAKIAPTDALRIVRALEIGEQTGTTASALREAHRFAPERYTHAFYVLSPPREALYEAIEVRTRRMFFGASTGASCGPLIDETERLVREGFRDAIPMGSVGYRQALQVVEGRWTLKQALEDTARETRRYAKRQLTWFRREPNAQWLSPPYVLL